jgi:sulfite dehydrogenase (quinone) subunit SoeC
VFTTAMIYTQIKAVPRWHHWLTPLMFVTFAVTGGAILSGWQAQAAILSVALALVLAAVWRVGDGQFARAGINLGVATGLDRIGSPAVFELPHTGGNYLTREMIHVVGRKHAHKLRVLTVILACAVPAILLVLFRPGWPPVALAAISHLVGAFAARWLFFAEAEHVVGLYYGAHQG